MVRANQTADQAASAEPDDGVRSARWLISKPATALAVAVRIVAAGLVGLGPWTDEAAELQGWDIERFVAIAEATGGRWSDVAIEYPPGSVVLFELLPRFGHLFSASGTTDVVASHRALILLTLSLDLALAWLLSRQGRSIGSWYLILGLALVPMGLLRLDLVVTFLAVAAALVAVRSDTIKSKQLVRTGLVGALVAAAVMVKIWPALLVPGLSAVRRDRSALASLVITGAVGLTWLGWVDSGLDPVQQVIDLRGATGWHLESLGGVITSLADASGIRSLNGADGPRLELNAFRTGTLLAPLVTVMRAFAVAVILALALRCRRLLPANASTELRLVALSTVMLGSTAALLVSSPLLSPQFLLWLTPWAALTTIGQRSPGQPLVLTLTAVTITGVTLALYGPPNLAEPLPAVALAVRNLLLVALPVSCWRQLDRIDRRFAG